MAYDKVAVIGFGEAGRIFAEGFLVAGIARVSAYDILWDAPAGARDLRSKAAALGVEAAADVAAAVAGADLVLSTVTADQTVAAAERAAPHLGRGQVYLDLNSTSPRHKARALKTLY